MTYRLCKNGRGVLMTREPIMITGALELLFEGVDEGYTAVIKTGEKVYYRSIHEGKCELEAEKILPGVISIFVAFDKTINPTWILDELYATCGCGAIAVSGNCLEYDKLLAEQRAEMDELRVKMSEFAAALEQFRLDFDEVYADTDILN